MRARGAFRAAVRGGTAASGRQMALKTTPDGVESGPRAPRERICGSGSINVPYATYYTAVVVVVGLLNIYVRAAKILTSHTHIILYRVYRDGGFCCW